MGMVIAVIGILLLFIPAVGVYTFFAACKRQKEPDWTDPGALKATKREHLISVTQYGAKWFSSHMVQDIYTRSKDGLRLYARWIPVENARGTILLAHGYRSTPYIDFSLILDTYHNLGLNMLIPDQRSHGRSEGKYITFGVKESEDMQCWVSYHNANFGRLPLIISGLSMGASTVLYMANEDLPSNVKGIIADCGFTSPWKIIGEIFKKVVHLPPVLFLWAGELGARLFAGFSFREKDTVKTLAESRLPVLLVHGKADTFVPCYMSEQAYAACTAPKELLLVENATHGYSFWEAKEEYTAKIEAFLHRYLEGQNELRNH